MAQILLFNIGADKLRRLRPLALRLGIRCRSIAPEEQGKALGTLCGREGFETAGEDASAVPFQTEMLVMDALSPAQFHGLLDGLRRERATVALKAVVTESNLSWTAARLQRELSAEHEAMKKAAGKSIHS